MRSKILYYLTNNFFYRKFNIMKLHLNNIFSKSITIPLILFSISFLIRIPFTSSSPNAWDSAEYLNWCKEFLHLGSIPVSRLQYCHPLYFVLIYISSLISAIVTGSLNFEKSAIFVSVLLGALSIIPMYYIGLYIFKNKILSVAASLLFSFCPVIWFYSVELMSDISSIFFILLGICYTLKWYENNKPVDLFIASVLIGLTPLIRIANFFVYPVFFFLVVVKCINKKTVYPIINSVVVFIPYILHILWGLFISGLTIQFLFHTTNQMEMSVGRLFTVDSWLEFIKLCFSSMTIVLSILFFIFLLFVYPVMLIRNHRDPLFFNLTVVLVWLLPYFLYWRTVCSVNQHVRLIIPIIPPAIIFIAYTIWKLIEKGYSYLNKNIFKFFWVITVFGVLITILIDYVLMYHTGYFDLINNLKVYLNKTNLATSVSTFTFVALITSLLGYRFILKIVKKFNNHRLKYIFFIMIISYIILHLTIFTVPLLELCHIKIQHEKSEAIWFADNTPSNSLIIAGHEWPFVKFYAGHPSNRKIVYVLYEDTVINEIKKAVRTGKKIFACSNYCVDGFKSKFSDRFIFKIIDIIPGKNIRNQYDPDFIYLCYATYKNSYDIPVYEIEPVTK